jgi:hypothetical protein
MSKYLKSPIFWLLLAPFVFFFKFIFIDHFVYSTSEILTTYLPNFVFMSASWHNGQIPWWHPYHYFAFVGVATQGVFYPFNILLALMLNPQASLNTFMISIQYVIILHIFMASIAMYLLMRRLNAGQWGSFFAGIAFAYSPVLIGQIDNPCYIYSLCYFPVVFLLFQEAFHRKLIYSVFCGLSFALMFLAGYLPVATYTPFVLIFYLLFQIYQAEPGKRRDYLVRGFWCCFVTFTVALLLIAPQILSTYEYAKQTIRMGGHQTYDTVTVWGSIPVFHLITFVMPFFFGGGIINRRLWLEGLLEIPYNGVIYYVGILVLILAIFSIVIFKDKRVRFFVILFILSLLAMLGYNSAFFGWLYSVLHLPLVRIPSRLALFTTFSLCAMAGFGLDSLINSTSQELEKVKKFIKNIYLPVLIFSLILLGLLYLLKVTKGEALNNADISFELTPVSFATLAAIGSIVKFLVIFISILVALYFYTIRKKALFIVLVVLIGVMDIFYFSGLLNPIDENTFIPQKTFKENRIVQYLQQDKDIFRVSGFEFPIYLIGHVAKIQHLGYTGGFALVRFFKFRGVEKLSVDERENALALGTESHSWFDLFPEPDSQLIDLYNIKYFIFSNDQYAKKHGGRPPIDLDSYGSKYKRVEGFDNLYINTKAFPRAFSVHSYQTFRGENSDEILGLMEKIDLANAAIVEADIAENNEKNLGDNIVIEEYAPSVVKIKAEMKSSGLLILTDLWYPGWKAYVDGKQKDILRTDYIFRGVLLDKGEHEVIFKYDPLLIKIGIAISSISFVLVLVILLNTIFKNINAGKR